MLIIIWFIVNLLYISCAICKLSDNLCAFSSVKSCFIETSFPFLLCQFFKSQKFIFPSSNHFHSLSVRVNQFKQGLNNLCYFDHNAWDSIIFISAHPFLYYVLFYAESLIYQHFLSFLSICFTLNSLMFISSRNCRYDTAFLSPDIYRQQQRYLSDASIFICRYSLISFTQLFQPTFESLSIKS